MQLKEIMSSDVECITPQDSIRDAASRMESLDVGMLPVCDKDRVVGVVTDRDITIRSIARGDDPNSAKVGDVMSTDVFYCFDDDDVQAAIDKMEERQVRRLLIMNRSKRLVGVVSLGDIATELDNNDLCAEVLREVSEPSELHQH